MNVRAVNEITISDLTDALTVILSSENYTFSGDENGAIVDSTCSITLAAYYGKTQCPKLLGHANLDCLDRYVLNGEDKIEAELKRVGSVA